MNKSISLHILLVALSSPIIFCSDNQLGKIDAFILKQQARTIISEYLIAHSKPENHFPDKEPIFITRNGSLQKINMPTAIKPLIIIIPDAEKIITTNNDIFCSKIMSHENSFVSKNPSNYTIHTQLGTDILPIDHCTHLRRKNESTEIISIFFDATSLSELISKLYPNTQEKSLPSVTNKKILDILYPTHEENDIVHKAHIMDYGTGCSEDEDEEVYPGEEICHVSVHNFWNEELSD